MDCLQSGHEIIGLPLCNLCQELHRSLEATRSGNRTEEDCLEWQDSDSVEEDVPVEPSEAEEPAEPPGEGTTLSLRSATTSPASGRCCSLRGASPTILEFKLDFPSKSNCVLTRWLHNWL